MTEDDLSDSVSDLLDMLNSKDLNQLSVNPLKPKQISEEIPSILTKPAPVSGACKNRGSFEVDKENIRYVPTSSTTTTQKPNDDDALIRFCNLFDENSKQLKFDTKSGVSLFPRPSKTSNTNTTMVQEQEDSNSTNISKTIRYLNFKPWSGVSAIGTLPDNGYYFKFYNGGFVRIIKGLLEENGFKETANKDWSVMWSCGGIPPAFFQQLMAYQKVNHFPRSNEITRKDLMSRNISKMAQKHGATNFNFVPKTFLIPSEMPQFLESAEKNKGQWYIVKPSANSQGKGIFVTDNVKEILQKQNGSMVVCHYISNPLLINDLKFDLRIYVLVTSINPLKIFIYDDGLVRFATQAYNTDKSQQPSRFIHLTNYSVNKFSSNFVHNKDAQDDASGNKWSLSAFKDYLNISGINSQLIFDRIEDVVVKTILSIEGVLNNAFEMHVPYRNNCFELLGFDILIDSNLKPWLLEVNLSPSMNTDSPLDLKIKGNAVADMLTLVGVVPNDQRYLADISHSMCQVKPQTDRQIAAANMNLSNWAKYKYELTKQEKYLIKESDDELKRTRKFKRIYPNENAYKYKPFFETERPFNHLLRNHEMDKHKTLSQQAANNSIRTHRTTSLHGLNGLNQINSSNAQLKSQKPLLFSNTNYSKY